MTNAKEYKPIVTELVDNYYHQLQVTEKFIAKVKETDNDEKLLAALQNYYEKFKIIDDALKEVAVLVQSSYENDLYKKVVKK